MVCHVDATLLDGRRVGPRGEGHGTKERENKGHKWAWLGNITLEDMGGEDLKLLSGSLAGVFG